MTPGVKNRRRGQAMVEFALVAPLFFILLFAIIEGGRFVFYYEMLNSATRDGARYAIIHGSNAADGCPSGPMPPGGGPSCDLTGEKVKAAVRKAAMGLAGAGDFASLDVYWCPVNAAKPCDPSLSNARGNPVTVRAAYTYSPVMPMLPPITIGSESSLVINN